VEELLEELDRKRSKNIIRTPSKSAMPPIGENISTRKRQVKSDKKQLREVSAESTTEERRSDDEQPGKKSSHSSVFDYDAVPEFHTFKHKQLKPRKPLQDIPPRSEIEAT
jgi:hypothetical protein